MSAAVPPDEADSLGASSLRRGGLSFRRAGLSFRRAGLSFRRATDADWAQLWPIWHEVVAAGDTYTYDPATDLARARHMWIEADGVETWLVEVDARAAGMYKIAPNQGGPGSHIANGSYMVDASVRGRGIGRALVEHSLRRARAAGYLAMQFNAVAATNTGAIALYERLGFTTIGVVPNGFRHPRSGLVGLHIMYRDLADQ